MPEKPLYPTDINDNENDNDDLESGSGDGNGDDEDEHNRTLEGEDDKDKDEDIDEFDRETETRNKLEPNGGRDDEDRDDGDGDDDLTTVIEEKIEKTDDISSKLKRFYFDLNGSMRDSKQIRPKNHANSKRAFHFDQKFVNFLFPQLVFGCFFFSIFVLCYHQSEKKIMQLKKLEKKAHQITLAHLENTRKCFEFIVYILKRTKNYMQICIDIFLLENVPFCHENHQAFLYTKFLIIFILHAYFDFIHVFSHIIHISIYI